MALVTEKPILTERADTSTPVPRVRFAPPGVDQRVAWFLVFQALLHIGLLGISDAILNFYFVSLGYGPETIGLLQSLPRLGGFLTSFPVGLLANRIGTRRITIYSTGGIAATFGMLIIWPSLGVLGVSRFLLGFFWGAVQIATAPLLISLSSREHETHAFAYLNMMSMGATALGSFIGGLLPLMAVQLFPGATQVSGVTAEQTPFAYRVAIAVAGITVILSLLPLLRVPDMHIRAIITDARGLDHSRRTPWQLLVWLSIPLLVFGFTGGLTFPFYNLFFRTTFAIPDKTVGTILSLGWLGMALVPLANPWWDRQFGRAWSLGIAMSVASIAFLGLSFAPGLVLSVVVYVVAISFRNMMQPLYQPLIMDSLPPDLHNITSSIGIVLWNIGWFSATAISGFWQETYGFGMIMRIVAAGVLLNGAIVVLIFRKRMPYHPDVTSESP